MAFTIGERIAKYRRSAGLSQEQLGEAAGISKQAISNYEKDRREPGHDVIKLLAQAMGINPALLYGIQDANDANTPGERLGNYMLLFGDSVATISKLLGVTLEDVSRMTAGDLDITPEQADTLAQRYGVQPALFRDDSEDVIQSYPSNVRPISKLHRQRVPLIGSVAAGEPIYDPEDLGVYVESPVDADAAITIRGDSMIPNYLDGDLVYIKARPDVPEGAVAVVFLDDEATLKHVYKRPTGLTLISDNMATHPPIMVEFEDYANVRIFGVPVGYTRIYKPSITGKIKKGF